jgi:hypothetical protein
MTTIPHAERVGLWSHTSFGHTPRHHQGVDYTTSTMVIMSGAVTPHVLISSSAVENALYDHEHFGRAIVSFIC